MHKREIGETEKEKGQENEERGRNWESITEQKVRERLYSQGMTAINQTQDNVQN